jgi:hypothetical protein
MREKESETMRQIYKEAEKRIRVLNPNDRPPGYMGTDRELTKEIAHNKKVADALASAQK